MCKYEEPALNSMHKATSGARMLPIVHKKHVPWQGCRYREVDSRRDRPAEAAGSPQIDWAAAMARPHAVQHNKIVISNQ